MILKCLSSSIFHYLTVVVYYIYIYKVIAKKTVDTSVKVKFNYNINVSFKLHVICLLTTLSQRLPL